MDDSPLPTVTTKKQKSEALSLDRCVRIQFTARSSSEITGRRRGMRVLSRSLIFNRCTYPSQNNTDYASVIAEYYLIRAHWQLELSHCTVDPGDIIGAPSFAVSEVHQVTTGQTTSSQPRGEVKLTAGSKDGLAGGLTIGSSSGRTHSESTQAEYVAHNFNVYSHSDNTLDIGYTHRHNILAGRDAGDIAVIKNWTNRSNIVSRGLFTEKDVVFEFKKDGLWGTLKNGFQGMAVKKSLIRAILDDLNTESPCNKD